MLSRRDNESLSLNSLDFCILIGCSSLAWLYCLELTWLVFYTFRRWSGLYFYAILIAAWGCAFHAIGWTLKYLTPVPNALFLVIVEIGWVSMVTGQSVVLYSRLHLVVRNRKLLRFVLVMIIIDAFLLHGPTIVLTIGTNTHLEDQRWKDRLSIMERIQLPFFCIQEFIISTIYITCTTRLLRSTYHTKTRAVMRLLITVNAICVGLDAILIGFEYSNNYVTQTSIKALLYAVKLKLEFAVLNQLMNLAHKGLTEGNRFGPSDSQAVDPYSSLDPPPVRDIVAEVDMERYRWFNLTGWPRGRLFGPSVRRRPAAQSEPTLPSQVTPRQSTEAMGGYRPVVPPKRAMPSDHLPKVSEELRESDLVWSPQRFPSDERSQAPWRQRIRVER